MTKDTPAILVESGGILGTVSQVSKKDREKSRGFDSVYQLGLTDDIEKVKV